MIDLHTIQAGMMKGKTMVFASCATVCVLGAEVVLLPIAMNSSYDTYIEKYGPVFDSGPEDMGVLTDEKKRPLPPLKPPRPPRTDGKDRVS